MYFQVSSLILSIFYFILTFHCIQNVSSRATKNMCDMKTDELIRHYGYDAEVHNVVTDDDYLLTVFRCNPFDSSPEKRKPVILQHGLLISSDDFCINPPNLSLAYILANNGYDVWLPNSRGNVYSREHVSKDPNSPSSGFWNFSWYEMGVYDQPVVIDYILQQTEIEKLYYVGFSQGTTSIMVLLSEKSEYNDKIHVVNMLAPVGYMTHSESIYKLAAIFTPLLESFQEFELLPRKALLSDLKNIICSLDISICNSVGDLIFGPSDSHKTNKMLPVFMCHVPSGSSWFQFNHYVQETNHMFFGRYMRGSKIPHDFAFSRITTPISLHNSTSDRLTNATDVEILLPKLKSVIFVQRIDKPKINHIDMMWSIQSASLIYSNILEVFKQYQ